MKTREKPELSGGLKISNRMYFVFMSFIHANLS